jgi:hypothetical protein
VDTGTIIKHKGKNKKAGTPHRPKPEEKGGMPQLRQYCNPLHVRVLLLRRSAEKNYNYLMGKTR